jgi:hypothetical protein
MKSDGIKLTLSSISDRSKQIRTNLANLTFIVMQWLDHICCNGSRNTRLISSKLAIFYKAEINSKSYHLMINQICY